MKIEEIVDQIKKRISILEVLYRERKGMSISEIADETGKDLGNVSKYIADLEDYDLVWTQRKEKEGGGRPKKIVHLRKECKEIVVSLLDIAGGETKLTEPNKKEVETLLKGLQEPPSSEFQEMALERLQQICDNSKIWEFEALYQDRLEGEKLWSFIDSALEGTGNKQRIALKCLRSIAENASTVEEEEVTERIYRLFGEKIEEIAESPEFEIDMRLISVEILDLTIPSLQEKWDVFAPLMEEVMRKEEDEVCTEFVEEFTYSIYTFSEFRDQMREKYTNWFFDNLMSDSNPKVRERASSFYESLEQSK